MSLQFAGCYAAVSNIESSGFKDQLFGASTPTSREVEVCTPNGHRRGVLLAVRLSFSSGIGGPSKITPERGGTGDPVLLHISSFTLSGS